jgi:hypothetical protein
MANNVSLLMGYDVCFYNIFIGARETVSIIAAKIRSSGGLSRDQPMNRALTND